MRALPFIFLFLVLTSSDLFAFSAVYCNNSGEIECRGFAKIPTIKRAIAEAKAACEKDYTTCDLLGVVYEGCFSVAVSIHTRNITTSRSYFSNDSGVLRTCDKAFGHCGMVFQVCEDSFSGGWDAAHRTPIDTSIIQQLPLHSNSLFEYLALNGWFMRDAYALPNNLPSLLNLGAVGNGLSFGIGLILALLVYARRTAIANFIIHGNLPYKLGAYADDIEVLFKRSQRVNWYGRVVFGIVVRLSMTEAQLALVRRYWLGRVIAFDSLRRQRQNQLARLHVQTAMQAKSDPHDKKKFWSRRWAEFRSLMRKLFWVVIALVNLLLSFFFIRVTIAKLVRGKLVESKDLVLIMQAKQAIEETAVYLKGYLELAETFDGREELFESK